MCVGVDEPETRKFRGLHGSIVIKSSWSVRMRGRSARREKEVGADCVQFAEHNQNSRLAFRYSIA